VTELETNFLQAINEVNACLVRLTEARWYEYVTATGPVDRLERERQARRLECSARELVRRWGASTSDSERLDLLCEVRKLPRPGLRNALVDIKLPGAILAEMQTTDGIIDQLGNDIEASTAVDDAFKDGWRAFRAEWKKYFSEHQSWSDRAWYSSYEKVVEYRTRALTWRNLFESKGGKASTPKDTPPQLPGIDLSSAINTAVLVGGAALLLILVLRR
jgi:hypothetical protein